MAKKKTEQQLSGEPIHYTHEGLRSIHLELENFKNIDKKIIDIGGRSMIFMGKNQVGKSTLIQAMMSPMNSKLLPSKPVKEGEENARISHTIGGNINGEVHHYIMDMYFSIKTNTGRLVITDKEGETVRSPATVIKNIIGNVSFDPTSWLNDSKADKLKTVKTLTGCAQQIDIINDKIKELKDKRKAKADRAEELEATVKNSEFTKEQRDLYSDPMPMDGIQAEFTQVSQAQQQWDGVKTQVDGFKMNTQNCATKINNAHTEIARLKALITAQEAIITTETDIYNKNMANIQTGEKWLQETVRPSIDEINQRMIDISLHNQNHGKLGLLAEQHKEMIKLKDEVEVIKSDIAAEEKKRGDLISKSQLPIEGFSFTDEEMFINGLPLEEGQLNTASLWDISVDIAIALNPNLKIIFLRDGNVFDKEHLKRIVEKIEAHNFMAVIELVTEDNNVECLYTEEFLK